MTFHLLSTYFSFHRGLVGGLILTFVSCYRVQFACVFFFRWLDRNEDDGQIVRELVPDGEGLRLFSKCKNKNILNQKQVELCENVVCNCCNVLISILLRCQLPYSNQDRQCEWGELRLQGVCQAVWGEG